MILSLIFSFLISNSALAAKCPGADVRLDQAGGSMEFVKPRRQEMNTCYAFAAAEVWDAYRFSHYDSAIIKKEKDFYTIPMQGALAINLQKGKSAKALDWNTDKKSPNKGTLPVEHNGDPSQTLAYFMSHPTCVSKFTTDELFTDLPGRDKKQKIAYLQSVIANGESVRNLLISYQNKAMGKSVAIRAELQAEYDKKYKEILSKSKTTEAVACFKKGNLDQFVDEYIKSAQFSENSLSNIQNALIASCEKRSAPVQVKKTPTIQTGIGTKENENNIMKDTESEARKIIHQALSGVFNKPTQPVILSACINFFEDGKQPKQFIGVRRNKDGSMDSGAMPLQIYNERCKAHALVVIGRKTDGNECKVLVRNTKEVCKNAGYSPDWKCDEQGDDVWVDENTLVRNTLNYSFIKD